MQANSFAAAARVGVEADHQGFLSDKKEFQLNKQWVGSSGNSHCLGTTRVMDECSSSSAI